MATGAAFDHAVELARANPTLDVGCHLTLAGGRSAIPPHRELPPSVPALIAEIAAGRFPLYDEMAAQVEKLRAAGIRVTHLDTHKHTHLLPPVLNAVARLSREFGIPWVRRPVGNPFLGVLKRNGCRITDHFAGFQLTGRFHIRQLVELIRALPAGTTEFMCHPGFCTEELRGASTRLKDSRRRELEALTAPETRRAIEEAGVELVSYRDL